jgi:hypothetical protein
MRHAIHLASGHWLEVGDFEFGPGEDLLIWEGDAPWPLIIPRREWLGVSAASNVITAAASGGTRRMKRKRKGKPTQSQILYDAAQEQYRIVQDESGQPIAVPKKGMQLALPFKGRGGSLRNQLNYWLFREFGSPASTQALDGVMRVLEAEASEADRQTVHLRSAPLPNGGVVVDLGHKDGSLAVVADGKWTVTKTAPPGVVFRRTQMTSPMPMPKRGGHLDDLRDLLNVTDSGWDLVRSWMACALRSDMPVPVLTVTGRQGSAKTMLGKLVVGIVDPNPSETMLYRPPKTMDDWPTVASGSRVVGLDNLSRINEEMSDALCRAVTGEAAAKRSLYTDDELHVVSFRRALLLTSIDTGGLRGDLAERLLPVELERIKKGRAEDKLMAAYVRKQAGILGGLLDLLAEVQANPVTVKNAPRMADAAVVMASVDKATGSRSLESYRAGLGNASTQVLESDPVAAALVEFVDYRSGKEFTGTATELYNALEGFKADHNWPANARGLSGRVKRIAPDLERANGISIEFTRGGQRRIEIKRVQERARRRRSR